MRPLRCVSMCADSVAQVHMTNLSNYDRRRRYNMKMAREEKRMNGDRDETLNYRAGTPEDLLSPVLLQDNHGEGGQPNIMKSGQLLKLLRDRTTHRP